MPRTQLRQGKHCTRLVALGGFTHTSVAGKNRFYFSGRLAGKKLAPAKYRLRAIPENTEAGSARRSRRRSRSCPEAPGTSGSTRGRGPPGSMEPGGCPNRATASGERGLVPLLEGAAAFKRAGPRKTSSMRRQRPNARGAAAAPCDTPTVPRVLVRAALAVSATCAFALCAAPWASAAPPIRHVFVIVLENKSYKTTFGQSSAAPYLSRTLTSKGALVKNYYAIGHSSLDNYIAMISGQAPNPQTQADCKQYTAFMPGDIAADGQAVGQGCVYPPAVSTIANQLDAQALSWHGYMQDMGADPAREA